MNKTNIIFLIFLFVLYGCGYQSVHQKKAGDFSITKFETKGERNISRNLTRYFLKLQKKENASRHYEITTNSKIDRKTISKNSKGETESYSIDIFVDLEVKYNNEIIKTKTFLENSNYSNKSNKFKLKQYEELIIENLSNKIIDRINFFINSLK